MNVKQCPSCECYNTQYSILGPQAMHEKTEVHLTAYSLLP